jgi:acetolactate synthase-1/2/3 large subunit
MDAWLASTPVVAFTGRKPDVYQHRHSYQEVDHRLLYESITKFNVDAGDPQTLPVLLRQAFREVTNGRPRPAHIDVTNHMGRDAELAHFDDDVVVDASPARVPAVRPTAPIELVDTAAAALTGASRPVIVAGRGAYISDAGAAIRALCRQADVPVVTTPDGKTLIDETDPLWAGVVGLYGMDCANRTVMAADLVVFIGTTASDQATCDWTVPLPSTPVIQIDIEPTELGRNYPNTIGLPGDAAAVVGQLLDATAPMERPIWRQQVAAYVAHTLTEYQVATRTDAQPISPARLCAEVTAALPHNAVLVADTGYSAVWSATMIRVRPGQKYLRAAGSLGWAFPAAIGAQCALPDRPVICFTGDGAMLYHLGELETAARYDIPVTVVVNNNCALAQCSTDLKQVHAGDPAGAARHFGLSDVNLAGIATHLGCQGLRVTAPEDLDRALADAIASRRPTLVEVMTDPHILVPPHLS